MRVYFQDEDSVEADICPESLYVIWKLVMEKRIWCRIVVQDRTRSYACDLQFLNADKTFEQALVSGYGLDEEEVVA